MHIKFRQSNRINHLRASRSLKWLLLVAVIVFGVSLFSTLFTTPEINILSDDYEDMVAISKTGKSETGRKTADVKKSIRETNEKSSAIRRSENQASGAQTPGAQTPGGPPGVTAPISGCPGNIPVREGQTVATGCGFTNGSAVCGQNTDQRECVTCQNGKFVNSRACDEALKVDPLNTILPFDAGYQYTGGTKENPIKVPIRCVDSLSGNVGNTASGNTNSEGAYCMNGVWIPKDDPAKLGDQQLAEIRRIAAAFCTDPAKPEWNVSTGQCGPHITTAQEEALANNIQSAVPCTKVGQGAGGCKSDETCVPVQYGHKFCQASSTISPPKQNDIPRTTYCDNNVFATWNQNTGSYNKKYCQYGCSNTACFDAPTTAITYPTYALCETNMSQNDTCIYVPDQKGYRRTPTSTPTVGQVITPEKECVVKAHGTTPNSCLDCPAGYTGTKCNPVLIKSVEPFCRGGGNRSESILIIKNSAGVQTERLLEVCGDRGCNVNEGACNSPLDVSPKQPSKIAAGGVCSSGINSACESNDCRFFTAPDGERNWFCMVAESLEENASPDGVKSTTTANGQRKTYNDFRCSSHDQCLSGFCSGLGTLSTNECKDNPFATNTKQEELSKIHSKSKCESLRNSFPGYSCYPTQGTDKYVLRASGTASSATPSGAGEPNANVVPPTHGLAAAPPAPKAGDERCTNKIIERYNGSIWLSTDISCGTTGFNISNNPNVVNPTNPGSTSSGDGRSTNPSIGVAPSQPTYVGNTSTLTLAQCNATDLEKARKNKEICWMKNGKAVYTKYTEIGTNESAPISLANPSQVQQLSYTCPLEVVNQTLPQPGDVFTFNLANRETLTGEYQGVSSNGDCISFYATEGSQDLISSFYGCQGDSLLENMSNIVTRTISATEVNSPLVAGCTRTP